MPFIVALSAWPALGDGPKPIDREALRKQAAAELTKKDTDRDGSLTLDEFLAHVPDAERVDRTRRFRLFDFDGNHKLDGDEFHTSSAPIDERGDVPDPIVDAEQAAFKKWEALFAAADRDGDGALSPEEWPAERIATEVPALADVPLEQWDRGRDGTIDRADGRWLLEVAYGLTQLDGRPLRTNTGRVFSWYYFRAIDKNGDGILSHDEFVSGHYEGTRKSESLFADLDANRDGHLTAEETLALLWHDTIGWFLGFDRNGDGFVSHDEFLLADFGKSLAAHSVAAFDADGDGKISFREFRGTTFANQASNWMQPRRDVDCDGRLSFKEFYLEKPPLLIAHSRFMFDHFDMDRNGFLSPAEFEFDAEFVNSDTDRDGQLTLEEFIASAPEAERAERKRRFLVFDFNGNGKLDKEEYRNLVSPVDERDDVPDPIVEVERAAFKKWEAIAAAADRDGDGLLRLHEWPAERIAAEFPALADVPFVLWEHDEDGRVSRADARWLFEVAYGLKQADGRPLRTSTGRVFSLYYFRHLDGNRDDVLSREEFISGHHSGEQNAQIFATLDANGDGQLTDRETWSLLWHDTIAQFLSYDIDLDGYLSADEMQGIGWGRTIARQNVPAFDDDGDGRLSFREFRQTTFANQARDWPLRDDTDHDGRLSWVEFCREQPPMLIAQSRFMFDHFDRNRDGFLSAREFTIEGNDNQQRILAQVRPLERWLPLEVEFAQHVCELTGEQTAALQRAGWFAIERVAGQVAENMRRRNAGERRPATIAQAAEMLSAPRLSVRRELVRALQPGSEDGAFPLVMQSPPEIWKKLDLEYNAAAKRRRHAAISAHVALLDEVLLLTDRQRKDLCRLLGEETNDAWWRPTNAGSIVNPASEQLFAGLAAGTLGAFAVPDVELAKMLTAGQLATLKELEQPWPQEVLSARKVAPRGAAPAAKAPAALGNNAGAAAQRAAPMAAGMFAGQAAPALVIQRFVAQRLPAEDEQRWFVSYVTRRLDNIEASCGISAIQREKLSLAAKLDVARWRDQRSQSAGKKLAKDEELIVRQVMARGGQPFSWAIFENSDSHFQKSLRSRLLDDQRQKLLAADRARLGFRRQALVEAVLTGVETAASLTADQCDLLAAEFKAEPAGLNSAATDGPLDCLRSLLQAPDEHWHEIIYEFQWQRFVAQRGVVEQTLRQHEMRQGAQGQLPPAAGAGVF